MKRAEENRYGSEDSISLRTLMIDTAAVNLRRGIAGEPLDPEQIRQLAGFSGTHTLDNGQAGD